MALGAVSQTFLKEIEAVTGLPVHVHCDDQLQAPLLAHVQVARGGMPFHRVSYHPSASAMADFLITFQCAYVLRVYALPPEERYDLSDTPVAHADSLEWANTHPASASLPPDRKSAYADFLRTSLMSMIRSIPVGLWIDRDLRERFPSLRHTQEQAIRRQIDTHALLLRPEYQQSVPAIPLGVNLAVSAAFAKFWGGILGESGWMLPYLAAGAMTRGEALLRLMEDIPPSPANDRRLIQSWADELGLGAWMRWTPYRP